MSYFSDETIAFLKALKANNNREWFAENKAVYEDLIKGTAQKFCAAMEAELEALTGDAHTSKLFRVYRDIRFSKDKTPYNAHIRISFTPERPALIKPSWFFGLDTDRLVLGGGVFAFESMSLGAFRRCVVFRVGDQLAQYLDTLIKDGYTLDEPELQRVPRGYDPEHPQADLLRHKGLTMWYTYEDTAVATGKNSVEDCIACFKKMKPVYECLLAMH